MFKLETILRGKKSNRMSRFSYESNICCKLQICEFIENRDSPSRISYLNEGPQKWSLTSKKSSLSLHFLSIRKESSY